MRLDADLLRRWTETLGSNWRKKRQKVIEAMMEKWIEDPYEVHSELCPRQSTAQERERYVIGRFLKGDGFKILDHKAYEHVPGWIVEERVIFQKKPKPDEQVSQDLLDALEKFEGKLDTKAAQRMTEMMRRVLIGMNQDLARKHAKEMRFPLKDLGIGESKEITEALLRRTRAKWGIK